MADTNPYQAPKHTASSQPNVASVDERTRRARIAMIPFAIAIPALFLASILWFWSPFQGELDSILFGVTGAILAFDLPVCLLVLIQWILTGDPPELSLEPLVPSKAERELRRELRERAKIDGDEFYEKYYSESTIPKRLVVGLRRLLESQLGLPENSIEPNDNMAIADPELDWRDLMDEVTDELGILIDDALIEKMDGTFDNLLRTITNTADVVPCD